MRSAPFFVVAICWFSAVPLALAEHPREAPEADAPLLVKSLPSEVQAGCAGRAYDPKAALSCAEAFDAWKAVYCASFEVDLWSAPNGPGDIFLVAEQLRHDCELVRVCPMPLLAPQGLPGELGETAEQASNYTQSDELDAEGETQPAAGPEGS